MRFQIGNEVVVDGAHSMLVAWLFGGERIRAPTKREQNLCDTANTREEHDQIVHDLTMLRF